MKRNEMEIPILEEFSELTGRRRWWSSISR